MQTRQLDTQTRQTAHAIAHQLRRAKYRDMVRQVLALYLHYEECGPEQLRKARRVVQRMRAIAEGPKWKPAR